LTQGWNARNKVQTTIAVSRYDEITVFDVRRDYDRLSGSDSSSPINGHRASIGADKKNKRFNRRYTANSRKRASGRACVHRVRVHRDTYIIHLQITGCGGNSKAIPACLRPRGSDNYHSCLTRATDGFVIRWSFGARLPPRIPSSESPMQLKRRNKLILFADAIPLAELNPPITHRFLFPEETQYRWSIKTR